MNDDITIRDLVTRSHDLAKSKGWYEGQLWPDGLANVSAINVPEKLALIHSEVSEALEAYRSDGLHRRCELCNGGGQVDAYECAACDGAGFLEAYIVNGKPEGFVVELADVVIRIADLCGALRLDLASAIETKNFFNETRSHRHGGKRA